MSHIVRHMDLPDTSQLLAALPTNTPTRIREVPVSAWDPYAPTPTHNGHRVHRQDGNYTTRTMTRPLVQVPGAHPGEPWLPLHHKADLRAYLAELHAHTATHTRQEAA